MVILSSSGCGGYCKYLVTIYFVKTAYIDNRTADKSVPTKKNDVQNIKILNLK